jgi:hypothetical protein
MTEVWVKAELIKMGYPSTGEMGVAITTAWGTIVRFDVKADDVISQPIMLHYAGLNVVLLGHTSDCALHNEPAEPLEKCSCGALVLGD